MSLINAVREYKITLHDCLLKQITQDIQDFELKEVIEVLEYSYKSKDPNEKRMATLFNAIFTHHSQTFLLTKAAFRDLIKNDNNSPYSNISGTEYGTILSIMLKVGHFTCLRPSTGSKAGVYKLVHPDFVDALYKLHSKEWFDVQEQKVLDYYDSTEKQDKPTKSIGDLMREKLKSQGF